MISEAFVLLTSHKILPDLFTLLLKTIYFRQMSVSHPDVLGHIGWDSSVIPKKPNGCKWVSKYSMFNAFGQGYLCLVKRFLFLNIRKTIFHLVFTWNIYGRKCYKNFLGRIFWGAHTVQTVPKYIWMRHWILCLFLVARPFFYFSII